MRREHAYMSAASLPETATDDHRYLPIGTDLERGVQLLTQNRVEDALQRFAEDCSGSAASQ